MFHYEIVNAIRHKKVTCKHEQIELLTRYREKGCLKSREKLANANIGYVAQLALQYSHPSLDRNDILQTGMRGLLHAMETFDFRPEISFLSYARFWADAYIKAEMRDFGNFIRVPASQVSTLKSAQEKRRKGKESEITDDEAHLLSITGHISGLDSPVGDSDSGVALTIANVIADENSLINEDFENTEIIRKCVESKLTPIQQDVIKKFFGFDNDFKPISPMTLQQIGKSINLSLERVRQIKEIAIRILSVTPETKSLLLEIKD